MSDFNMEEYTGLADTGFINKEQVAPEDEFFHSIYISGQTRKNHINIEEITKKIQVRGVEYNLDQVCMIITNVKDILVNASRDQQNREKIDCFCYKSGPAPWKGTSERICGLNSTERASNPACSNCRSQIIVSGIYCDINGKPLVNENNKPVFVFLRAKGMKYSNVSDYLGKMFKKDLSPIFTPVTDESKKFEKAVVNNKRFVTIITQGEANSKYGTQNVFELDSGVQLQDNVVKDILKISKKTIKQFNEKFDWSKNKIVNSAATGYGDQTQPNEGVLSMEQETKNKENKETENTQESQSKQNNNSGFMSFDDIEF